MEKNTSIEASGQFPLRLPLEMREAVKSLARDNMRSMNSEIILRLTKSLKDDGYWPPSRAKRKSQT